MTLTPYMGLTLPGVGTTLGPLYASQINNNFTIIAAHNHVPGGNNGQQVPTAGIFINDNLSFNSADAIELRSTRYHAQGSPLSAPSDIGCLYVSGVDLYYNDGSGNQIRMTSGGAISGASSGSISGLTAPASASYGGGFSGAGTFTFQQNTNRAALLNTGDHKFLDATTTSPAYGVTIKSPGSVASDITLTLPGAYPGSTSFVTMTSSGVLGSGISTVNGITAANLSYTAPTAPTMLNSWVAALGLKWMKSTEGVVKVSGAATAPLTPLATIFQFPAGSRPLSIRYFYAYDINGNAQVPITVQTDGTVQMGPILQTSGHVYSLDTLSFIAGV